MGEPRRGGTKMNVTELFAAVGLKPQGPVPWNSPVPETKPGVYVVALSGDCNMEVVDVFANHLNAEESALWIPHELIVYIGQTRCKGGVRKRVAAFYRHKYGRRSPHRGGQSLKLINCDLWVYWAVSDDPIEHEKAMLQAFKGRSNARPFANRKD
jgi:hypothetical protein